MTVVATDGPGRERVKVGRADGATRIWVCEASVGALVGADQRDGL